MSLIILITGVHGLCKDHSMRKSLYKRHIPGWPGLCHGHSYMCVYTYTGASTTQYVQAQLMQPFIQPAI